MRGTHHRWTQLCFGASNFEMPEYDARSTGMIFDCDTRLLSQFSTRKQRTISKSGRCVVQIIEGRSALDRSTGIIFECAPVWRLYFRASDFEVAVWGC